MLKQKLTFNPNSGPVVRIGRNEVHIRDTEFMYKYTTRRDVAKCDFFYQALEGTVAACTDVKEGMKRRAEAMPAFTGKHLQQFSSSRLENILDELCTRLEADSSSAKGGIINASHLLWAFANDVTSSFLFGKSLNWLQDPDLNARHESRGFEAFRYTPLLGFPWFRRVTLSILQSPLAQAWAPGAETLGVSVYCTSAYLSSM